MCCSILCKACSYTCFRSSLTCFVEFVSPFFSLTLPWTVRLFYVSLHFQAPQQQYTVPSFSSMRKHGHSQKLTSSGITLWAYLSQTPRPNLGYYIVSILSWTSCKRQSQKSKFDQKTTLPHAPSYVTTHYHYVHVTERYMETLHMKKMASSCRLCRTPFSNYVHMCTSTLIPRPQITAVGLGTRL